MRDAAEEVVECSSVVALLAASRLARHGNEAIDRIVLLERKVGHHEGVVICAAGLALLEADWDLHAHTPCRRPDLVEPGTQDGAHHAERHIVHGRALRGRLADAP